MSNIPSQASEVVSRVERGKLQNHSRCSGILFRELVLFLRWFDFEWLITHIYLVIQGVLLDKIKLLGLLYIQNNIRTGQVCNAM